MWLLLLFPYALLGLPLQLRTRVSDIPTVGMTIPLLLFFWVWTANKFIQSLNQVFCHDCLGFLTQFRMDLFGAAHGWRGLKRPSLSKTCHTYLTLMKLGTVIPYLKKTQKIHKLRDTPLQFCWHHHFFTENQQFLVYQEIQV